MAPHRSHSSAGVKRGTLGPSDIIEINYVRLNLEKMVRSVYHYDVTITPDRPKKHMRIAFDQFQREFCPSIQMAYDGVKSCYTAQKIPLDCMSETVIIDDNGRTRELKVVIKETEGLVVDMNALKT